MLRFDGKRLGSHGARVDRSAFAKGVEFTGRHHRRTVALVVRSGRCIDKAGKNTGMRATLTYGKKTVRGCAMAGAPPIART